MSDSLLTGQVHFHTSHLLHSTTVRLPLLRGHLPSKGGALAQRTAQGAFHLDSGVLSVLVFRIATSAFFFVDRRLPASVRALFDIFLFVERCGLLVGQTFCTERPLVGGLSFHDISRINGIDSHPAIRSCFVLSTLQPFEIRCSAPCSNNCCTRSTRNVRARFVFVFDIARTVRLP